MNDSVEKSFSGLLREGAHALRSLWREGGNDNFNFFIFLEFTNK